MTLEFNEGNNVLHENLPNKNTNHITELYRYCCLTTGGQNIASISCLVTEGIGVHVDVVRSNAIYNFGNDLALSK